MLQGGNHEGARIAFFGGSFDPPHRGHLAIARAAQTALHLDTVLFAPVGAQPLKPQGSTAAFDDRLAMTRLAIAGEPGFGISLLDAPSALNAPNFTIDALQSLHSELPANGALFCLMGADSFLGLRRWHRGAEIPFVAPLIVASRPGRLLDDLSDLLPAGLTLDPAFTASDAPIELHTYALRNSAGATAPFYLLPGMHIDISASSIRQQIPATLTQPGSGSDLSPAVLNYIVAHSLYR
ncbi:MAG: nicotinate (nicotinamide) nucleotide adenylyltransferase [Silvibacterium sp.]